MKTYKQYLSIIKKREQKEWESQWGEIHKEHIKKQKEGNGLYTCFCITGGEMTFDYLVEIIGMMMEDFLKEFKKIG